MATTYHVAWWNLENLFDHRDAPRTEKLQRAIGSDLAHWTPELRDRKIAQLAAIIRQFGGGSGPDLLGVCEVENATVLQRLVTRVEALKLPSYSAFVMPRLSPVRDESGAITDVEVTYPCDLEAQMLEYSSLSRQ